VVPAPFMIKKSLKPLTNVEAFEFKTHVRAEGMSCVIIPSLACSLAVSDSYIYTYIHTYINIHYMYVCMYVCICIRMCIYACTHTPFTQTT
jgi:hypothetical protein